MGNLGFSIFGLASSVFNKNKFYIEKYKGRKITNEGYEVSEFNKGIKARGLVQPIQANQYKEHGLDFTRHYITIYTAQSVNPLTRVDNADRVIFNDEVYHVLSVKNWSVSADYIALICVRLDDDK